MISIEDFILGAANELGRDVDADTGQSSAIRAPITESLRLLAGPGSGKTTVIVLRVLKLIFVDDVEPSRILVTTYTKKAAAELRSRILGWGDGLRDFFINRYTSLSQTVPASIKNLNLNSIQTGTIDSVAQELLTDNRVPGETPPIVMETFVCQSIMARSIILGQGLYNDQQLIRDLAQINVFPLKPKVASMSDILIDFKDRFRHDQVNVGALSTFTGQYQSMPVICSSVDSFNRTLDAEQLYDFSKLENQFLASLRSSTLSNYLSNIQFVLIDEYQDTNLSQEQTYLLLGQAANLNGGSMVIVGDDDQSIFRFRGATVDLFTNFPTRAAQFNLTFRDIYLSNNYRSTDNIVNFSNDFVTLDQDYQVARIVKPLMTRRRQNFDNLPILGMFRDDINSLATDLCNFIFDIVNGPGFGFSDSQGTQYTIRRNQNGGSSADVVLLCSSPNEFANNGRARLPLLVRQDLALRNPSINIFNPRGQNLEAIPEVQQLCGLMLECIDPLSTVQNSLTFLTSEITSVLTNWRQAANVLRGSAPLMNGISLDTFVDSWQNGRSFPNANNWNRQDIPLIELAYKLVTWIPPMQDDVEGLVYLEAICRAISQAAFLSRYESKIRFDGNNACTYPSVKEAIVNIFVPISGGSIQINEDLLETVPSDRLSIMSVHQAKGLEFPLVIVDVGSDFRDLHSPKFRRFPINGGRTCNLEDAVRGFSTGLNLAQRSGRDRAFDDLIRQYYVAYSRAQDVLLLVGLRSVRDGYLVRSGPRNIPNVATGWDRTQIWRWGRGLRNLVQI